MPDLTERIRAVVEERMAVAKAARLRLLPSTPKYPMPGGYGAHYALWMGDLPRGHQIELDDRDHARLSSLIDPADAILDADWALGVLERHVAIHGDEHRYGVVCKAHHPAAWPCAELRALALRFGVTDE